MKVEIKFEFNLMKIYFNDSLFLFLKRDELIGIHSWKDGTSKYCIEFCMKTTSILTEYDKKEKWENILQELDKCSLEF